MLPFNLPLINRPILWYGFFFALGFLLAYFVLLYLIPFIPKLEKQKRDIAEKIALYAIIGGILGARLGDILFYQPLGHYIQNPLAIFKVWEGGLASHGGALGILLALALFAYLYRKKWPQLNYRTLLDLVVIPVALTGSLIRIGNFFNQEILGVPSTLPWAITFLHPVDGGAPVPRHPVQLYESLFYFLAFLVLVLLWRSKPRFRRPGRAAGLFMILVFGFRFLIEFIKVKQSVYVMEGSPLSMGHYLSIPLVLLGFLLYFSTEILAPRKK